MREVRVSMAERVQECGESIAAILKPDYDCIAQELFSDADARALKRAAVTLRKTCSWRADEDGNWDTTCGNKHILIEGTPSDNRLKFCGYCGGRLRK